MVKGFNLKKMNSVYDTLTKQGMAEKESQEKINSEEDEEKKSEMEQDLQNLKNNNKETVNNLKK
jgi:hypothetical protein